MTRRQSTSQLWDHRMLNGGSLFALVTLPLCAAMLVKMSATPLGTAEGISAMIAYSVRWAVPWLFLAFAASALQRLFPGAGSRWLLRNRRIFGLCFSTGMAWQAGFILWLVTQHREYYLSEVYVLRDAIEGVIGYGFLIAMTLTSFRPGRRLLSGTQWRRLHTLGMYFLWAYAFSTYWHELYYYPDPDAVDYLYYTAGVLAWSLRLAAWTRQRLHKAKRSAPDQDKGTAESFSQGSLALTTRTAIAALLLTVAAFAAFAGGLWMQPAYEGLYGFALATPLELYFPFWPFIPFLPLFCASAAAFLVTKARAQS